MRNVFRCTRGRFGRLHCVFMKLEEDPETGRLEERGCRIGLCDEYRLYPEHHSNGDVVHNRIPGSSDAFEFGVDVIYENISTHETGLTFNRKGRLRAEEYNMHPGYFLTDINEPKTTGPMADNHVGYAFGNEKMSISPSGWNIQRSFGRKRVEDCIIGIYGRWDQIEKMVIPKCLRDYTGDIKDWVNYTAAPNNPRKRKFFIANESKKKIYSYCIDKFGKTDTAIALFEIMLAIKDGEFINLREAMINHGLSKSVINRVMNEVSTKGKKSIYSNMNLQKYWIYWRALPLMGLSKEKLWLFRCHLLNYVLNYPGIAKLKPEDIKFHVINSKVSYPPNRRYWWVTTMVESAIKEAKNTGKSIITNPNISWMRSMFDDLRKPKELPEDDLKNPPVETFSKLVGGEKDTDGWRRRERVFARILRAGRRWAPPEVRVTWVYFLRAYDSKKPEKFWQYIESVRMASPMTIANLITEAGIAEDVEFTEQKAFAHHLLEARKSRKSFEVSEPKLCERWQLITPKGGFGREGPPIEKNEIFWARLRRVWLMRNKQNYLFQFLTDNISSSGKDADELRRIYEEVASEEEYIGRELDEESFARSGNMSIVDIDDNEIGEDGEEDECDSDSQD